MVMKGTCSTYGEPRLAVQSRNYWLGQIRAWEGSVVCEVMIYELGSNSQRWCVGLLIGEAYAEDPDEFRSARSPVVVDLNDSRTIYPNNLKPQEIFGAETRKLDLSKPRFRRIVLDQEIASLVPVPRDLCSI
jgi:hypothetical protein